MSGGVSPALCTSAYKLSLTNAATNSQPTLPTTTKQTLSQHLVDLKKPSCTMALKRINKELADLGRLVSPFARQLQICDPNAGPAAAGQISGYEE